MTRAHLQFFARTILVRNNDIDAAYKQLDRILSAHRVLQTARHNVYYEKPFQKRNRLCHEKCRRIYGEEMRQKLEFVSRTNRVNPWPR